MSKKLMSVILVAVLVLSMGTVAMASVSAEELPAKADGYNRYYFYMPESWYNDYASTAGIYWWEGSDLPGAWPGVEAKATGFDGIYYYDVCQDVTTIIWNNFIDGGMDDTAPIYTAAYQTNNVGAEYYEAGDDANEPECPFYPNGTDSFDEMIYVIDNAKTDVSEYSGKSTFGGAWFYYYGNGEYGTTPEKGAVYYNERTYTNEPTPVGDDEPTTTPSEPADDELKAGFALIENPSSQEGISEVKVGDTVTYVLNVATPENKYVEDFQGFVTYNAEYLEVLSAKSTAAAGAVINTKEAGTVYFNATEVNTGMNLFERPVISIEFKVLDAAEGQTIALPEWTMEEMTEFNGDSYFTDSEQVNDDVNAFISMLVPTYEEEPKPTDPKPTGSPTPDPVPTKPTADTEDKTDATSGKDDNKTDADTVPTGTTTAIFVVLAVLALAGAAVVVLRKKVNA